MKRFPSIKTVLLCSFSAALVVLSIPTNPHPAAAHRLADAVPTLAPATVSSATGNSSWQGAPNRPPASSQNKPSPSTGNRNSTTQPAPNAPAPSTPNAGQNTTGGPSSWGYTKAKMAKLRVRVIDGRTRKPLSGAEVVVIETEKRLRTGANGYTPWFDAPVIRNPKYRPMVAELHGQLGVIVYKNGYRDSIHLGIRMHEGIEQQTTVWMYKLGPGDRRVEPVLYQAPYHHIWLIQLADKFRQRSQIGEGPERP
ncbi:hypothetical protein NZD89_21080 [Alicyclobacillus fastidiosus]|uniref:Uncharacterized protein n=1 Tax=Alicyclobacillus fastidiosus TaxID=392011 RepID=A0ABY6ZF73_9BACL|nr:hypothetical protein [Alicyclobacillus fastidiosus]WAH40766.1 hypothetical protein NZD89_21080 [Alicyclobacillus fastidiosus]GMA62239.1 hypothetical protein GCM10025859_26790 [Alicyclobacillus fastidiosus]